MSDLLRDEILKKLDFTIIRDAISSRLLEDEEFYKSVCAKMLDDINASWRGLSTIEIQLVSKITERIMNERGQEIMAKVDMQAILNALVFRLSSNVKDKLT